MINLIRDHYQALVILLGGAAAYTRLQIRGNSHTVELAKHQVHIDELLECKTKVTAALEDLYELRAMLHSGVAGRPPFLTELEHEKKENDCRRTREKEIKDILRNIDKITVSVEERTRSALKNRDDIMALIASITKDFHEKCTAQAVEIVGLKTEIKNMQQDWSRRNRFDDE